MAAAPVPTDAQATLWAEQRAQRSGYVPEIWKSGLFSCSERERKCVFILMQLLLSRLQRISAGTIMKIDFTLEQAGSLVGFLWAHWAPIKAGVDSTSWPPLRFCGLDHVSGCLPLPKSARVNIHQAAGCLFCAHINLLK